MAVTDVETYDLVASLGGNCTAANNLIRRGLRKSALPFDWMMMANGDTVRWLADHVADGFAGLCLRENLELIPEGHPDWNRSHPERVQYRDRESGYFLYNHFNRPVDEAGEYGRVHAILRRRVDRLLAMLDRAESALLVLATVMRLRDEDLLALETAFARRFPRVRFKFVVMKFKADREAVRPLGAGIEVREIVRNFNPYDFFKTNYEWAFLDGVRTRERAPKPRGGILGIILPWLRRSRA